MPSYSMHKMRTSLKFIAIALGISCMAVSAETIAKSQIFGVAAPACAEQSQLALNRCAVNWSKTSNFLRSLIYDELYGRLTAPMQSQLVAIEQSWNSYRDTHCKELSAPFRTGSIYPLLYHSCKARATNDRIADLQGKGSSQLTPDATTQGLAKILNQGNLKNSTGQVQWLRYQALQCQFESSLFTENAQSAKQCRDRLAASRLRELESMIKPR
jgi:uncharacterized protein YecT (DUF1311 family)